MNYILQESPDDSRNRGRRITAVQQTLRELVTQLSLLNHQVSEHLDLRPADIQCLDLIATDGPLSPTALAKRAALHPATMTGILDRLERGRWVARDRDPADRRGVLIRALRDRGPELVTLYGGMNHSMNRICADYSDAELDLITDFLTRTVKAGRAATDELTQP
jgi:DNA-binding MarR family transcriptional regulator